MKLHRVRSEAMLGGVCAGLAKYLGIDPTIIRLVFVILAIFTGIGVLVYVALWFLVPAEEDSQGNMGYSSQDMGLRGQRFGQEVSDVFSKRRENTIRLLGIGLVLFGLYALLRVFIPNVFTWVDQLSGPAFLIVLGGILLFLAFKGGKK